MGEIWENAEGKGNAGGSFWFWAPPVWVVGGFVDAMRQNACSCWLQLLEQDYCIRLKWQTGMTNTEWSILDSLSFIKVSVPFWSLLHPMEPGYKAFSGNCNASIRQEWIPKWGEKAVDGGEKTECLLGKFLNSDHYIYGMPSSDGTMNDLSLSPSRGFLTLSHLAFTDFKPAVDPKYERWIKVLSFARWQWQLEYRGRVMMRFDSKVGQQWWPLLA